MILPFDTPYFRLAVLPNFTVTVGTPAKADYYRMIANPDKRKTAAYILDKYSEDKVPFTTLSGAKFVSDFIKALEAYREENMDVLKIPEQVDFKRVVRELKLPCITSGERLVYEHSGLDFIQQGELPVTEYWLLLADAMKMRIMQRTDGDEYLEQCYRDMHQISTLGPNITE